MVKIQGFLKLNIFYLGTVPKLAQSLFLLNFRHKETIYIYKIRIIKKVL